LGIIKRDGRVFSKIIQYAANAALQGLIRGHVAPDATVFSDGRHGFFGLVDDGFKTHLRINTYRKEGNSLTEGDVSDNGIKSFWSVTNRRPAKSNETSDLHFKNCECQ
jgi:transposase